MKLLKLTNRNSRITKGNKKHIHLNPRYVANIDQQQEYLYIDLLTPFQGSKAHAHQTADVQRPAYAGGKTLKS